MSDYNDCRILWTDFEKSMKHVIKNHSLAEELFFSKTMMDGQKARR